MSHLRPLHFCILYCLNLLAIPACGPARLPPSPDLPAPWPAGIQSEMDVIPLDTAADRAPDGEPLPHAAIARVGTTRFRHAASVEAVAFSPNGKTLVSVGSDGAVRLWELETGRESLHLSGHGNGVTSVDFAPDGKTFATGCVGYAVTLWDAETGAARHHYDLRGTGDWEWITSVDFAPGGGLLAAGSRSGRIYLLDPALGTIRKTIPPAAGGILALRFSPQGDLLVSGGEAWKLVFRNSLTGQPVTDLPMPGSVCALAFAPNGKCLAAGCRNGTVHLIDIGPAGEDGVPALRQPRRIHGASTSSGNLYFTLAFSPDGKTLAVPAWGQGLLLLDAASGRTVRALRGHKHIVACAAYSPAGTFVASGGMDQTVRVWDVATGHDRSPGGISGTIAAARFTPDGRSLVLACGDGYLHYRHPRTGRPLRPPLRHAFPLDHFAVNPHWGIVATTGYGGRLRIRDVPSGSLRFKAELDRHAGRIAYAPDGSVLAIAHAGIGVDTFKRYVTFHDAPPGRLGDARWTFEDVKSPVAFSPDGWRVAAFRGDGSLQIRDTLYGEIVTTFPPGAKRSPGDGHVLFLPDGEELLTIRDGLVRVLDARSGREIRRVFEPPFYFGAHALSRDGRLLAAERSSTVMVTETTEQGRTVRRSTRLPPEIHVIELASGRTVRRLPGHRAEAVSLDFSPGGRYLASASRDTTVLIWDLAPEGWMPLPDPQSDAEIEALWTQLEDADAERAWETAWRLTAFGRSAVRPLRACLSEPPKRKEPNDKRIRMLIAALDAPSIEAREEAAKALEGLSDLVVPALRDLQVNTQAPAEMRARAMQILTRIKRQPTRPALPKPDYSLRHLRAIHVLERIGSGGAKNVLEMLANESPSLRERREAKAALERLGTR